jgi:hypothetical protein
MRPNTGKSAVDWGFRLACLERQSGMSKNSMQVFVSNEWDSLKKRCEEKEGRKETLTGLSLLQWHHRPSQLQRMKDQRRAA